MLVRRRAHGQWGLVTPVGPSNQCRDCPVKNGPFLGTFWATSSGVPTDPVLKQIVDGNLEDLMLCVVNVVPNNSFSIVS